MKICGLMKTTLLDFPGHVACTVFTGGCNFRCPFCHNSELLPNYSKEIMSTEEFFAFLDKRKATLEGVAITGGEPTMQKDLPDFARHIKGYYGLDVKLDTNGTNVEMLDGMVCEGLVDYVAMDIKAGPSGYSRLAGIPVTEAMMSSIRDCIENFRGRFDNGNSIAPYELRTTVVGGLHTDEDFHEIAEFIKGTSKYVLQCYKDSENVLCKDRGFYSPSAEDMLRYKEIVAPYVGSVEIRGMDNVQ